MFFIVIFLLGLSIGSFLNSVIFRLKTGESFLFNRSHCPLCQHRLGFFDLVPLFSFIFLKGKCRYCKKSISWQYPMVELVTGIIFVLISNQFLISNFRVINGLQLIAYILQLFFVGILIIIFVYDLKWSIIPDPVVWSGIVVALITSVITWVTSYKLQVTSYNLLAAAMTGGFFLILVLVSKERWMGWGDVKLGLLLGLILGWPNILVALFLAFVSGALVGLGLILAKKKSLKDQIPFGPFLCGATMVTMLLGEKILDWYLGLLLFP